MTRHYLDHASTTPLRPEAMAAMAEWSAIGITADPGRVHTEGRMARGVLEDGRDQVAGLFGVRSRQVIFTSGGTESINTAVWGAVRSGPPVPVGVRPFIVCAAVERAAVREASARLGSVRTVGVDHLGRIDPLEVRRAIEQCIKDHGVQPRLVHCQWANHEVGTVQPVAEVAAVCNEFDVLLAVDAVAAAGHLRINLATLGADVVSVSSHALGGPPGIGALIVRSGLRLDPLVVGGEQERARRAGLENVPAAVGFGAVAQALSATGRIESEAAVARDFTSSLRRTALSVEGVAIYGDPEPGPLHRLDHMVCLGIDGVEAEPILLGLDQAGIAAHSGSSCASESLEPSPVLEAMGVDAERSLRLSVGWSTTSEDVEAFAGAFPSVVQSLRALRS